MRGCISLSVPGGHPESPGVLTERVRCGPMVHGGVCLARGDEGVVLVEGALPGELVEVEVRRRRRGVIFAETRNLVEPSPDRVAAPCPYVPRCGGCQLQHVSYSRQSALKRDIVEDAMRRAGVPLPQHIGLYPMERPWNYRWRGELHVIAGRQGMADADLGFKRAHSWTAIAIDDCLIHHRTIVDAFPALRRLVREGSRGRVDTLHLTVGEAGEELLVSPRPAGRIHPAAIDMVAVAGADGARWVTDSTTLRWRDRTFRVSSRVFVQVNWEHMDVLYGRVMEALGGLQGARLVDAYAGIGVLGVVLASEAREVVCVESNPEAARLGSLNAEINGVAGRLRYVAEPAEEALPRIAHEQRVDALIIDPPRAGCDARLTAWLALAGPDRIVYVSCDPATLARDLHVLAASGPYRVAGIDVVDMFPHTYHVECVATLRRAASAPPGAPAPVPPPAMV